MNEFNIDCMKYRKSTHLASFDVDVIVQEKGICILTVEKCYYSTKVQVHGKSTDSYFIKFVEPVKEMLVNATNRKTIAKIVKELKNCTATESRNIGNWTGIKLQLYVDENVKFGGEIVSGIRVLKAEKQEPKKTLQDALIAFDSVSSRDTFVNAMSDFKVFMSAPEVVAKCTELSKLYPKPQTQQ